MKWMKKITMFIMASCPYCKKALRWMDELRAEDTKYGEIETEIIDESARPDIARRYDYYYVPAFFIGEKKLHEGAADPDMIRRVFDVALEE